MDKSVDYSVLLSDPRWLARRDEILRRDNYTCQFCGATERALHVHHRFYKRNLLPWQYDDGCLATLCDTCHGMAHQEPIGLDDVKIGDVFEWEHSDYENVALVYNIDYENGLVYSLNLDSGSGMTDSFDIIDSFANFCRMYDHLDDYLHHGFIDWFKYQCEHLSETPRGFRCNFPLIIHNNPRLRGIYNKSGYGI